MSDYKTTQRPFRRGRSISARKLNRMAEDALDQRPIAGPSMQQFSFPGGTVLQGSSGAAPWYYAYTGPSGIPPRSGTPPANLTPGSNPCRIYRWTGVVLTLLTTAEQVRNPWSGAVGGGRLVKIEPRWGTWWVANEDCVAAGAQPAPRVSGFSSTAFSEGFGSTAASGTQGVTGGAFSMGFKWQGFGGSGVTPGSVDPDPPAP
jgi:hypothetical protein